MCDENADREALIRLLGTEVKADIDHHRTKFPECRFGMQVLLRYKAFHNALLNTNSNMKLQVVDNLVSKMKTIKKKMYILLNVSGHLRNKRTQNKEYFTSHLSTSL